MRSQSMLVLVMITLIALWGSMSVVGAEQKELTVISHRVHQDVALGGEGKGANLLEAFEKKYGAPVQHQTFPVSEIHDKLLRLGPLSNTKEDVIYVDYNWADFRTEKFLVALDDYVQDDPIEGFPEDWPKAMVDQWTFNGKIYAIPVRAGTSILFYNQAIFEERGIAGPPTTVEELIEIARKATFTRDNGEKVHGFVCKGSQYEVGNSVVQVMSQMYGGYPWSPDFEVQTNSPAVIKGVNLLKMFYDEEILPINWATYDFAEVVKVMQEGRAAMGIFPHNYGTRLNDPEQSANPGSIFPAYLPLAKEAQTAERKFAGSFLWFWSLAILNGSDDKDLAWEFIHHLSTKEARMEMAKSGNATARLSVTAAQENEGVKIAAAMAPYSYPANPPSPHSNEIIDIIGEHVHNVVLHARPAQAEMDAAAEEIKAILEE